MTERTPMDGALRQYLDELALAAGPAAISDAERVAQLRLIMPRALASRAAIPGLPNAVEMREVEIAPGLGARLYLPAVVPVARPVLVYLHGGGWVVGSTATHDPFCRLLSAAANIILLSVDYRLAPEHRYPAALEDTLSAVHWTARHARDWGGDPARLALGGDSAGANLAAVAVNRLCGSGGGEALRAQLLLYPATDCPDPGQPSYQQNATGNGLEAAGMRWFWNQYAPDAQSANQDLFPLRAPRLPQLPATLVATAEYDVLRDDGLAYADKLSAAGVAVTRIHAADMHHNFPVHPGTVGRFPQCQAALAEIAAWLRTVLV